MMKPERIVPLKSALQLKKTKNKKVKKRIGKEIKFHKNVAGSECLHFPVFLFFIFIVLKNRRYSLFLLKTFETVYIYFFFTLVKIFIHYLVEKNMENI